MVQSRMSVAVRSAACRSAIATNWRRHSSPGPQGALHDIQELLFEVSGGRFTADDRGVVTAPGAFAHTFVSITDRPEQQFIQIRPEQDAMAFFLDLADVMRNARWIGMR